MQRLIDAKEAERQIKSAMSETPVAMGMILRWIRKQPTIDAEPVRHGHWIMKKTSAGALYTVCSHCNASVKYNDEYGTVVMNLKGANYCPNCGADMRGGHIE